MWDKVKQETPSTGYRASSTSPKIVQCLYFIIVNVDNTSSNKHVVEKHRSMFRDITEIAGNFVLIQAKILMKIF